MRHSSTKCWQKEQGERKRAKREDVETEAMSYESALLKLARLMSTF